MKWTVKNPDGVIKLGRFWLRDFQRFVCALGVCGLLVLFIACGGGTGDSEGSSNVPDTNPDHITELGVRVHIPDSVYDNCLYLKNDVVCDPDDIDLILLSWVDLRLQEWIASHPQMSPDKLLNIARQAELTLIDGWFLVCDIGPGDLCNGLRNSKRIAASIYNFTFEMNGCRNTPAHLAYTTSALSTITGSDYWLRIPQKYGCGVRENYGIPALVHEFNHFLE